MSLDNNLFKSCGAAGLSFTADDWISVNIRYRAA